MRLGNRERGMGIWHGMLLLMMTMIVTRSCDLISLTLSHIIQHQPPTSTLAFFPFLSPYPPPCFTPHPIPTPNSTNATPLLFPRLSVCSPRRHDLLARSFFLFFIKTAGSGMCGDEEGGRPLRSELHTVPSWDILVPTVKVQTPR